MPTSSQANSTAQRVLDVLRRIEARHADPAKWCQGKLAIGRTGRPVKPTGHAAVATCLEGARDAEAYLEPPGVYGWVTHTLREARQELYPHSASLTGLNDLDGYEAVRADGLVAVQLAEAALAEARP